MPHIVISQTDSDGEFSPSNNIRLIIQGSAGIGVEIQRYKPTDYYDAVKYAESLQDILRCEINDQVRSNIDYDRREVRMTNASVEFYDDGRLCEVMDYGEYVSSWQSYSVAWLNPPRMREFKPVKKENKDR